MLNPMPAPTILIRLLCVCLLAISTAKAQDQTREACEQLIDSGYAATLQNKPVYAIELLQKGVSAARRNNWPELEFAALNNLGNAYYYLSDPGEALHFFLKAHTIAIRDLTPDDEIVVLNNIAILYADEEKYEQAKEYFRRGYEVATRSKDHTAKGVAATNLGNLAFLTADYGSARRYFREALALLQDDRDRMSARLGLANCDVEDGNPAAGRNVALELLAHPQVQTYQLEIAVLCLIAESYQKENRNQEALDYALRALRRNPNAESRLKIFRLLTDIQTQSGRFEEALRYKDSVIATSDKLNQAKKEQQFESSKMKFELQNYKHQSRLHQARLESERRLFYLALFFIVIVLGMAIWLVRNASVRHKQKKLIAERNERILALELEQKKRESEALGRELVETRSASQQQKQELKEEVEHKNRKLSAKSLYLSGRNETLEGILSELARLPQVAKDRTLTQHIQALRNQIRSDNEWDHFVRHFEEVNQGLLNKLLDRHPGLNTNDIRFICYRYMNLSIKEIAASLNITQDSCRKRKERVYAKLGLPPGANLNDYLRSL